MMRVLGVLGVMVGKYVDGVVLRVVYSVGCCGGSDIEGLYEALWRLRGCGVGGGDIYIVRVDWVLWLVV